MLRKEHFVRRIDRCYVALLKECFVPLGAAIAQSAPYGAQEEINVFYAQNAPYGA
jgi:hypothetical protein